MLKTNAQDQDSVVCLATISPDGIVTPAKGHEKEVSDQEVSELDDVTMPSCILDPARLLLKKHNSKTC